METQKLLDNVSGTASSTEYFIENDLTDNEVQAFITFSSGTVTLEASGDNVNFAPIKDGVLTSSELVPLDLAEGSYFRVSYASATGLTVIVKPKKSKND